MSLVVVNFLSGEEARGNVLYFSGDKPTFHLQVTGPDNQPETRSVYLSTVRTVSFLKTTGIRPHLREEKIHHSVYAGTLAFKLVVELDNGQILHGSAHKYSPNDKGFFLVPLSPADRSERIYVNARAVKNVDCKRLIGKVLVDHGKITSEQLRESLSVQKALREKRLGEILHEASFISKKQLNESLEAQKTQTKPLGEILLDAGYITREQLDYALAIQHANRTKKLGRILVELKYVTPNDICIVLATQFHMPWVDLSRTKISPEAARLLPAGIAFRLGILPIELKGKTLVVATSRPFDPAIKDEVTKITSLETQLVVAFEGYIEDAITGLIKGEVAGPHR